MGFLWLLTLGADLAFVVSLTLSVGGCVSVCVSGSLLIVFRLIEFLLMSFEWTSWDASLVDEHME